MKKVLKKRTGFTLVELLIVIIIIGILAGAMLLVAGSGTDKAEATKIISNLRSLKSAALMYYSDNPNAVIPENDGIDELAKYMDRKIEAPDGVYVFVEGTVSGDKVGWFVGIEDAEEYLTTGIKDKLKAVATEVGLLPKTEFTDRNDLDNSVYDGEDSVYMRAR